MKFGKSFQVIPILRRAVDIPSLEIIDGFDTSIAVVLFFQIRSTRAESKKYSGSMQENQGSAENALIQDLAHTLKSSATARKSRGSLARSNLDIKSHYAEGLGNLRGGRSCGMKARTTHNQTTERELILA
ncbi:MAG TPA: hypothetical protein VMU48_02270 [Terracidiphilus sp.]|nr:hypothetical protein [Terracidiphilus sp.]